MSLTIGEAFRKAARELCACATPEIDARALLKHVTGLDDAGLIAEENRSLSDDMSRRLDEVICRRVSGEPVSQIIGFREFWGMRFDVAPGILTPRPDTETLIQAFVSRRPDRQHPYRILDLGLGSGCILGALLSEYPAATGVGVDIDAAAVEIARRNLDRLGFSGRACFIQGDWCAAISGQYDLIVSNPPYIPQDDRDTLPAEVREYESARALFAGEDGLSAYRRIASEIGPLIAPNGLVVLEAGAGQADDIVKAFKMENSRCQAEFERDLAGHRRAIVLHHA